MARTTRKVYKKMAAELQSWQREPNSLITSKVQFWRDGIMLTAQMSLEKARDAVASGSAFVISDQAIGAIIDGEVRS